MRKDWKFYSSFALSAMGKYLVESLKRVVITLFIESLSDIPMFYIKYLTMHKVHRQADAIRQLLYGCAYVREVSLARG